MSQTCSLIVSASIVYKKMITTVLEELVPHMQLCTVDSLASALQSLATQPCQLVCIDTALTDFHQRHLDEIKRRFPQMFIVVIGDKHALSKANIDPQMDTNLFTIIKPLDEGYEVNLRTIQRGVQFALLQLKRRNTAKDKPLAQSQAQSQAQDQVNPLLKSKAPPIRGHIPLGRFALLLIASSTGGPNAVAQVLKPLPRSIPVPILVVQHMPAMFTKNLADSLDANCQITVLEAVPGDFPKPGHAYIAPGGLHLTLDENNRFQTTDGEYVNGVKPAADVLFEAVARQYRGKRILVVVLTGMGCDGTRGVGALKKNCQCYCLTQSEASCTVYGMPRAVVEAGLSDQTVNLEDLPDYIAQTLGIDLHEQEAN